MGWYCEGYVWRFSIYAEGSVFGCVLVLRYCDIVNAVLLVLVCGWWVGWEWEVGKEDSGSWCWLKGMGLF